MFRNSVILNQLTLENFKDRTSSAEDSLANRLVVPASERELQTIDGSGLNSTAPFAILGHDGHWSKTLQGCCQLTLAGSLEEFSATWPKAGTMQAGRCYRRAPWVHHTHGKDCSLWPTPKAKDGSHGGSIIQMKCRNLNDYLKKAFGPEAKPNPNFTEWLMGFPQSYTALKD